MKNRQLRMKNSFFSNLFYKKHVIVTHDGNFHADEIFAIAVLYIIYKGNIKVIRTRDKEIIDREGEYILDVGGKYNPKLKLFDHHQLGGAGVRDNGIEYATFGLIWKEFGAKVCGSEEVREYIDERLVQPIDANDNGIEISISRYENISPYRIQSIIATRLPSWKEEGRINLDREFWNLVLFAKDLLSREIEKTRDLFIAREHVLRAYVASKDKRLVFLPHKYPFEEVLQNFPEPLFVVYPRSDGSWGISGLSLKKGSFELRKMFPEAWAGFKDEALEKITGVFGARFCHRARFLLVADTKEAALLLAQKALEL